MKKLKTRHSAAKRYHQTATGKIRRRRAYKSHLLTKNQQQESIDLRNF